MTEYYDLDVYDSDVPFDFETNLFGVIFSSNMRPLTGVGM